MTAYLERGMRFDQLEERYAESIEEAGQLDPDGFRDELGKLE